MNPSRIPPKDKIWKSVLFWCLSWGAIGLAPVLGCDYDSTDADQEEGKENNASDGSEAGDPFEDSDDECHPETGVFDHALCVCENMTNWGNGLNTHTLPGYGKHRGHVGVNGNVDVKGNMVIDGNFDIGGAFTNMGNVVVNKDMSVGRDALIAGRNKVYRDARFGGNLAGAGVLDVLGNLEVTQKMLFLGKTEYTAIHRQAAFQQGALCACGEEDILDIEGLVAQKRNAPAVPLPTGIGHQVVTITAGDYYSKDGSLFIGNWKIKVEGTVRLFVESNLDMIGNAKVELMPGATLDIYISGTVRSIGNMHIGDSMSGTDAEVIRLYVGGNGPIALIGNQGFSGGIYAPRSYFDYTGNLRVLGSLFVRELFGKGNLTVTYNSGLIDDDCEDLQEPDDGYEIDDDTPPSDSGGNTPPGNEQPNDDDPVDPRNPV